MRESLKPCPFCGAGAQMHETDDGANFIECDGCKASSCLQYSIKEDGRPLLIEKWNVRTADRALSQAQQALREIQELADVYDERGPTDHSGNFEKIRKVAEAAFPSDVPQKGEKVMNNYENDPNVTRAHEKAQEFIRKHPNVPVVDVPEVSEDSDVPEAAK